MECINVKKLITSILTLAIITSFAVLPSTASAEGTTYFKYENDFSQLDAPGADSTGAWDKDGVGEWVTVKTSENDDRDQWNHDAEAVGPSGEADGVLKLGDGSRAGLYFDTPITSGNVHVSFDFYYGTEGDTRSNHMYSYHGFMNKWSGENVDGDALLVSGGTSFDKELVKALMTMRSTGDTQYKVSGLGDESYGGATNLEYNTWKRVDLVLEDVDNSSGNMAATWYIDGAYKFKYGAIQKDLNPLNGFIFQTNGNFDNEYMLIDNLVIETYTGTRALTASVDKTELKNDENSVTFTFSDDVDTSLLTKDNITVTKDYEAYSDFELTNVTAKTVTISGLSDDGVYNVSFADKVVSIFKGALETKKYIILKGKLSNFVYKQDFTSAAWDSEGVGTWMNETGAKIDMVHDDVYAGADGKPGVMKLGNYARPVFVFDKAITDGTIHLSYKIKFDQSTANYPYYYSGFVNEKIMTGATVENNTIKTAYASADLVDTYMAHDLGSTGKLSAGVIGTADVSGNKTNISFDSWNRVDVILSIRANGQYYVSYYINGEFDTSGSYNKLANPFYGFTMYPINMGTGNVYVDDLLIEHSYNDAVISDVDLSTEGKVKVTIPDTFGDATTVRKVIVAGYDNEKLINVKFADFKLGRTTTSVDVDFVKAGCDEIKVFLWNSFADLKPLANAYTQVLN